MALAKRQRLPMTVRVALALVAALLLCPIGARADVTGEGDVTPSGPISLPIDGGPVVGDDESAGDVVVGGTGLNVQGTTVGRLTIDVPAFTLPLSSANGYIGFNADGMGEASVSGFLSEWFVENSMLVGVSGLGFLNVTGGAYVHSDNLDPEAGGDFVIGQLEGSQGYVTVNGFGSKIQSTELSIGQEGMGRLEVANRGRVETLTDAIVGEEFDLTGDNTIGTGYVVIDGAGSRWNVGNTLDAGSAGDLTVGLEGWGSVEIRNQGMLWVEQDAEVGALAGAYGEVRLSGKESLFHVQRNLSVAESLNSQGQMHIESLATVRADGSATFGASALIEFAGGTLLTPAVNNSGVIRGDGRLQTELVVNDGDIRTAAGIANLRERLWITGDLDNNNVIDSIGGEMEVEGLVTNNAGALIYGRDAVFRFRGDITGPGEVVLDNSIMEVPIATIAFLEIGPHGDSAVLGDLVLGGGTLAMTVGDDFSQLLVTGDAFLDGHLDVSLASGYVPEDGDSFELIHNPNGVISGTFNTVYVDPTPGIFWQVDYTDPESVFLNAFAGVAPDPGIGADFDNSNLVDGLDLVIWKNNYGMDPATQPDGDANYDGVVDGSDFLKWQRQVGTDPVSIAPVPEPSTVVLALFGLTISLTTTARRTRR